MNKHTKGPWHIQYYPHCTAIYAGEEVVGYIDHFNEHDKRLVTSAPELLEALKEMLVWFNYHTIPLINTDESDAITKARNAVAKARGTT